MYTNKYLHRTYFAEIVCVLIVEVFKTSKTLKLVLSYKVFFFKFLVCLNNKVTKITKVRLMSRFIVSVTNSTKKLSKHIKAYKLSRGCKFKS